MYTLDILFIQKQKKFEMLLIQKIFPELQIEGGDKHIIIVKLKIL